MSVCLIAFLGAASVRSHSQYTIAQSPPKPNESMERRSLRQLVLRYAHYVQIAAVLGFCGSFLFLLFAQGSTTSIMARLLVCLTLCEAVIICTSPLLYVINQMMAVDEHDATDIELQRSRMMLEGEHSLGEARRRFLRYIFHEGEWRWHASTVRRSVVIRYPTMGT